MAKTTRKKLRVSELEVYLAAQRGLSEKWAENIAANFDEAAVGTLIISLRDGHYYIIDGQTRKRAFELLGKGEAMVDCLIYEGLTIEEEAALFILHNTSRKVKSFDKFRVRLTAKDETALAIAKTCKDFGITIKEGRNETNHTSAVSALERIYSGRVLRGKSVDGASLLVLTLDCLKKAWHGEPNTYHGNILIGLSSFLARHQDVIEVDRLVQKMAKYNGGPAGVIRNARSIQTIRRIECNHAYATVFTDIYNTGLRSGRLPDWRR